MYNFNQRISPLSSSNLKEDGLFLWIWNPSEKSPHIGISLNGMYFSLQLKGKQENILVAKLITTINRRKTPVLFVELNSNISITNIKVEFEKYTSCQKNDCSCTAPLFKLFGIEREQAILFDLLEKFENENRFGSLYESHLSLGFKGIPEYTFEDVQNNLLQLNV